MRQVVTNKSGALEVIDVPEPVVRPGAVLVRTRYSLISPGTEGNKIVTGRKSLLGKAHTVMAEGGMAASLAHVDDRDGWTTHFRDTMVGGYRLNNPRMAELHAKEAPERVRELVVEGEALALRPDGRLPTNTHGGQLSEAYIHGVNGIVEATRDDEATDVAILGLLYAATGGDGWNDNTNWLVGDPCVDAWYGVTCDESGNVTELNLVGNNLVGTIPPEDVDDYCNEEG